MKTTTVFSVLLAAGSTAVAAPAKRAEFEGVTINSLSATLTETSASVQLGFSDPNYDDSTEFNLNWYISTIPNSG